MQPPSPASPRPDDSQNDPGSADPASTTPVPDPPVPALSEKRKREDDDHDDNLANGLDEYGIRISRSPEKRKKPTGWDDGTSTKTLSTPTPEHQTPVTGNGLSADQRERLEKAKAFARETTAWIMLQRKAGMPAMTHPVLSASPITFLPAMEARCIAIMSRIYVGSINFELTEVHISAVFGQFGHVKSVSLMMDSLTGKHKGFCFVEYEVPEAAELALSVMNGADLGGRNLKVGRPNNYNHNIGASLAPASPSRIYVANVSEQVSEENVESIFEAFGKITGCSLLPDAVTRKHKGNGYIEFEETVSADAAIAAMNNFELGGVPLRVRKAIIGGPMPPGMKNIDSIRPLLTPGFPQTAPKIPMQVLTAAQNINNAIAQRTGFPVQSQASALSTNAALQSALAKVQASVNDEHVSLEENMSISASQRYEIMQKLMRNEVVPQQMISSRVICLRNMVSVKDVDDTLNDEISEECGKYGVVTKVLMWARPLASQPSDPVDIYVRFGDVSAAGKARQALDQRWFAGRQVAAAFCPEKEFADKEAESKA